MKNIQHTRYKFSKPINRFEFWIDSKSQEDDIEFILNNEINSIVLNVSENYCSDNLNILEKIQHIEYLEIVSDKIIDFNGLMYLKNLKSLYISDVPKKQGIDLKQKQNLHSLNVPTSNIIGLEDCKLLSALVLRNCSFEDVDYRMLPNLDSLDFIGPSKIKDLNFLPKELKISKLVLSYLTNLSDISFINEISNTLAELEISNCKKIISIEAISNCTGLTKLILNNSIPLPNAQSLSKLTKLKHLAVLGTSYFIDGDISLIKEMNIEYVGIDDKKHYSLKTKDFSQD